MNEEQVEKMYSKVLAYNGYNPIDLINEIQSLNKIYQNLLISKLGLDNNIPMNNNDISKHYYFSNSHISKALKDIYKMIKVLNFDDELERLLIECPGHSMDELLDAIKLLSPRERDVIILKLGLNGRKRKSYEEISKYMNLELHNINAIYSRAKDKIKKIINEKNTMQQLLDKFYLCEEKDILEVIESLTKKEKIVLKLHMGLLGLSPMRNKDISELLNISQVNTSLLIKRSSDKLYNKLIFKQMEKEKKLNVKVLINQSK